MLTAATGRLRADGTRDGRIINTIDGPAGRGLRATRSSAARPRPSRDRYDDTPNPAEQDEFTGWLQPLIGKVDIVMVHEPALIEPALQVLKDDPPVAPARLPGRPHAQGGR